MKDSDEKENRISNLKNMFDHMNDEEPSDEIYMDEYDDIEDNNDDFTEEEFDKALDSVAEEMKAEKDYQIDKETGEVLQPINTFDKETMKMLYTILDGKITIK